MTSAHKSCSQRKEVFILTEREFIDIFEQQKSDFLVENVMGANQINILNQFEEWIKENIPVKPGAIQDKKVVKRTSGVKSGRRAERKAKEKKTEPDFGEYLEEIVRKAEYVLAAKGIQLNCVAFDNLFAAKQSSKCIKICDNQNIFCRIGKSWPRKGKYQGRGVVLIELVMDGFKTSVFLPLLKKIATIESRVGMTVEREMPHIENAGKYRFKLFFPFGDDGEINYDSAFIGRTLAEFIFILKICLEELGL
jgi:hypothetical protein